MTETERSTSSVEAEPAGSMRGSAPMPVPSGVVVAGELMPPPSKSVSHRYLNLSLLGRGTTRIERLLAAEDIAHFLAALEVCGCQVTRFGDGVEIDSSSKTRGSYDATERAIYCGNAGTMYRFLIATLTTLPGHWLLDGTTRLRERPVGPLVTALRQLGAEIECRNQEGFAPLAIHGGSLLGGRCRLDASSSSQFLSALLMAGTRAPEPVVVDVEGLTSEPYVAITLEALAAFGLGGQLDERSSSQPGRYEIDPIRGRFTHRDLVVEGDYSAAAYPAAAAALTGGSVTLVGLRRASSQGDRGFLDLLSQMGAEVDWHDSGDGERLIVRGTGRLAAVDVDLSAMPDQVPTLAALAAFAEGVTTIRNVPHLRLKESDRLQAMAIELTKAGVEVEELADGLRIHGLETAIRAGSEGPVGRVVVDPHDDHRIAMSMALVGLRRPGVEISTPQVVAKSYPDFWRDLSVLVAKA